MEFDQRDVDVNGTSIHLATAGAGPTILMLHGFPHTWRMWEKVIPALAADHQVVAADLRGLGGSERAASGYDARTLSEDVIGLLDALDLHQVDLVATDASVPPAFLTALEHPERIDRLVLLEGTLGTLAGAEDFFAAGPPWWFGFHQVADLPETVLEGHEVEYVTWFLRAGTRGGHGLDPETENAIADCYRGRESLRCAFEHYRSMPASDEILHDAVANSRLEVPTLAIGAFPVGDALSRQLEPVTDELRSVQLDDCGHIVALDQPDRLSEELLRFFATTAT